MPSLEENDQSNVPMYKKISSRENLPLARVRRQRKEIDDIKHNNEIIRLEAIRGRREAHKSPRRSGSIPLWGALPHSHGLPLSTSDIWRHSPGASSCMPRIGAHADM
mgnify:CR=1 FL=1